MSGCTVIFCAASWSEDVIKLLRLPYNGYHNYYVNTYDLNGKPRTKPASVPLTWVQAMSS